MAINPVSWGVVGALVVVIGWVLRHLAKTRQDFLAFMGNHMSKAVQSQEHTAKALYSVSVALEKLNIRTEKCLGPKEPDE